MKTINIKGKELSNEHKKNISKGLLRYYDKNERTGTVGKNGYKSMLIHGRRVYEHQLIWEQHYGEIPKGYHIHHKNGNKLDNRIDNLECVLCQKHLSIHAKKRNFGKNRIGISPLNKTSEDKINEIRNLRREGYKLEEIVKIMNISYPTIQKYSKGVI